ncbi:MAG TPA: glycosyltransferase [Caulobacteraceae bacterium]|nr:glycosyltransferase [Caulobacteraceae bacterium]
MNDSALPRVSVIIPHYRDLGGLRRCLDSLAGQTYPAALTEIIVADNASPEGEAAVAAVAGEQARVIVVTERGAGPARNGGARIAGGEVLAFIDSDCVAEPAWLSQGVAALAGHDFVGGRVKVLVDDVARMTPVEAFERVFAFDFETYITRKGFTGSGNLFCPRTVFEKVGGFRATVSEDVEWSHRATGLGYRLGYAPGAIVGHPARKAWPELVAKWRRTIGESYALVSEKRGGRAWWLLRTLALPASAVAHMPRVLASPELQTAGQKAAALATLFRIRFWRLTEALRVLGRDLAGGRRDGA